MDRTRANKNVNIGLRLAALAVVVFALTFYVAILYVG